VKAILGSGAQHAVLAEEQQSPQSGIYLSLLVRVFLLICCFCVMLPAVGVEADAADVERLLKELEGKDISELIAAGREKLQSVPSGGGAVAAAPAAGGAAGGAAAPKEEKKEEPSEEDEVRHALLGGGGRRSSGSLVLLLPR
jgi:ribosomal protein L12E/L44/L45/RPP1/RPP2